MKRKFDPVVEVVINLLRIVSEGSECPLEDSNTGECKKIYECPSTMKKVLSGLRGNDASDRCGFDGIIEIVCCPLNVIKIRGRHDHHIEARPAETGKDKSRKVAHTNKTT